LRNPSEKKKIFFDFIFTLTSFTQMNMNEFDSTDTNLRALRREFAGYAAHLAVVQNDSEALQRAVAGVGVDATHHHGHTPLTLAIVLVRVDLVGWLIANGANMASHVNIQERNDNHEWITPLELAARQADERIMQLLLVSNRGQEDLPCDFAAQNRNERVLALLLDANALYNFEVAHIAAANENPAVIQLLIDRQVNLLACNSQSLTPLHIAARDNRNERVLAAMFAAVDVRDFQNFQLGPGPRGKKSLLHCAAENKNDAVLALVLAHVGSGDINARDEEQCTPCFYAAINSNEKVLAMLMAAGADARVPFQWSSSALCLQAARNSNEAVMAHLLAAGAWFHTSDMSDNYPVQVAAENKNERVLAQLLAAGAEHRVVSPLGYTVCMMAAKNTNEAVMKLLLALPDIDLDSRNARGQTACQIAQACGNLGVAELLIGAGCTADATTHAHTLLWCADRKTARLWLRRGVNLSDVCLLAPDDVLPVLIAAGADVPSLTADDSNSQ
jgi:ankyrin repeat protein